MTIIIIIIIVTSTITIIIIIIIILIIIKGPLKNKSIACKFLTFFSLCWQDEK